MDRITEIVLDIVRIIGMILGEEALEEIWDWIKVIEVDIERIIEMIIMKEAEAGLMKSDFYIIIEGMTETVVLGLDQLQELIPIEIGSDAISAESMIILLKIV